MIINPYVFQVTGGYGYLYNWYAASDANFAPTDWKVATKTDYDTLITQLGGTTVAGGKMKETGFNTWDSPNTGADNSSGFTALGSGYRLSSGTYSGENTSCFIWTSTEFDSTRAVFKGLSYTNTILSNNANDKEYGNSIRLLYTGAGTPTTVTDNDGNIYDVVLIGTQRWTVQNWKCTTLDNGTSIPNVTDSTTWAGLTTLARCAYGNDEGNV